MKILSLAVMFSALAISKVVCATILPQDFPVFERQQNLATDPALEAWFDEYASERVVTKFSDFDRIVDKGDRISAYFAAIDNSELAKNHGILPSADRIKKELTSYLDKNANFHPLHDYILRRVSNSNLYLEADKTSLKDYWDKNNDQSCARRDEVGQRLLGISSPYKKRYEVKRLISEIESYNSEAFKTGVYRKFVKNLKKKELRTMMRVLAPTLEKYGRLDSFSDHAGQTKKLSQLEVYEKNLKGYRNSRNCNSALVVFEKMAQESDTLTLSLDQLVPYGKMVARCYRSSGGVDAYAAGWDKVAVSMTAKFGDAGYVAAMEEKIRVFLFADNYDAAKKTTAQTLARYVFDGQYPSELSGVQLLLSRLYEEQGRIDDALENYRVYRDRFPSADQYEAIMQIVLLNVERKNWQEALTNANQIIELQDRLPESDRDVSKLGFALFWGGRSAINLSMGDVATHYWSRLSLEFYSTYYGAVAHYLLENLRGETLALQPSIAPKFSESSVLYNAFAKTESYKIDRVKQLLILGKKEDAACETSELEVSVHSDPDKAMVAKSLLYYASGKWLTAIKIYGNLPRTLRKAQPNGMEKILFPIRYIDDVKPLAEKLDLDPFFVISLIRQESLFNPKAYSSAGAIGLMQMLKSTAQLEARRLDMNYVENASEKKRLLNSTKSKWDLFDPETNLKLGIHHLHSLLKQYGTSVFTLSAYNAGPGRVNEWKKRFSTRDLLLFTEKIPYKETRGYVKLIMRNYFYYKRWFHGSDADMPLLDDFVQPILADLEATRSTLKLSSNLQEKSRGM